MEYKVTVAGITVLVQPESEKRKQKKLKRQKKQELKELKRLKKRQNKALKKAKKDSRQAAFQKPVGKQPPPAPQKQVEKSGQTQSDAKKEEAPDSDMAENLQLLKNIAPHIKKLLGKITIYDVYIDFVIGGEDAAKVAISYGVVNAFLYSFLGWLNCFFKLKIREVKVEPDFRRTEGDYFAFAKIRLSLFTVIRFLVKLMQEKLKIDGK